MPDSPSSGNSDPLYIATVANNFFMRFPEEIHIKQFRFLKVYTGKNPIIFLYLYFCWLIWLFNHIFPNSTVDQMFTWKERMEVGLVPNPRWLLIC